MISKPKSYITVVTIPKDKINKLDIVMGTEPLELMSKAYARLGKPSFMLNGGFFDTSNGKTASNLIDEGIVKGKGCSDFGLMANGSSVKFSNAAEANFDFVGGTPALVKNGVIDIDQSYGDSFNNARHPRSAVGDNKDNIFLVAVDGRTKGPGMTLKELAEFMLSIGCVNAINLDGGGSTRLLHNGAAINKPTENRAVDNFICVYLIEGDKVSKLSLLDLTLPKVGCGYVWGSQGEICTKEFLNKMIERFGSKHYYFNGYNAERWVGKQVFDCSGLIVWAGNLLGILKGDYTAAGLYNLCDKVTNPVAGDLCFNDGLTHVGIYAGNGKYLHAKGTKYGVVITDKYTFTKFGRLKGANNAMNWEEKNKEFIKYIQKEIGLIGSDVDGLAGTKTLEAFDNFLRNKNIKDSAIKEAWNKFIEVIK